VPTRNNIIINYGDYKNVPCIIPWDLDDVAKAQLKALVRRLKRSRVPSYELAKQFDNKVEELRRTNIIQCRSGVKYTVVVDVMLVWDSKALVNRTAVAKEYNELELRKDGLVLHITPDRDMTHKELVDSAIDDYTEEKFALPNPISESRGIPDSYSVIKSDIHPFSSYKGLADQPMEGLVFKYAGIVSEVPQGLVPGQCAIDYILWESQKENSDHTFNRDELVSVLGERPTTRNIIEWAKNYRNISVYAVAPTLKLFCKHISTDSSRMRLYFIVNNGHCYPITNDAQRKQIASKGCLSLAEMPPIDENCVPEYCNNDDPAYVCRWLKELDPTVKLAIVNRHCLKSVMSNVIKSEQTMCSTAKIRNNMAQSFVYPTSSLIVVAGQDYLNRKMLCDAYFATHRIKEFQFVNQSWGVIGMTILEAFHAKLQKSSYSQEYIDIVNAYPIVPYRMGVSAYTKRIHEEVISIDTRACYPSLIKNSTFVWNHFDGFQSVQRFSTRDEILPGEYYINKSFKMGDGSILIKKGMYPHNFTEYALNEGYITKSDISLKYLASSYFKNSVFASFIEEMSRKHPDEAKNLINMMIGCLGIKYTTKESVACCEKLEHAMAVVVDAFNAGKDADIQYMDSFCIVSEIERTQQYEGHLPIHRQIIAQSIVNLDKLQKAVCIPGTKVVGYNTDAIKVIGHINDSAVKEKDNCVWGEYHIEPGKHNVSGRSVEDMEEDIVADLEYVETKINKINEKDALKVLMNDGGLILGGGGCGKSTLMSQIYNAIPDKKGVLAIAFSHKACRNLRDMGVPMKTIDSALWDVGKKRSDYRLLSDVKLLFIDELYTVSPEKMTVILKAKQRYGFKLICAGDKNQCSAITQLRPIKYETNGVFLRAVAYNVVECEYKKDASRYDADLHNVLMQFLATGRIPPQVASNAEPRNRNMCFTNKTRESINAQVIAKESGLRCIGALKVKIGMKMMCYKSDKDNKIYNTEEVVIHDVEDIGKTITVMTSDDRRVSYSWVNFCELFNYIHCTTIHKYQGGKIDEPFTIYDSENYLMTRNLLYTAISRATRLEDVFIAGADYDKVYRWDDYSSKVKELSTAVSVKVGRIYRITMDDGYTYIGQTTKLLNERLEEHHRNPVNAEMEKHLNERSYIDLIEEISFIDDKMLDALEERYIQAIHCDRCLNVQHRVKEVVEKEPKARVMKKGIAVDGIKPARKFTIREGDVAVKKRYIVCEGTTDGKEIRHYFYISAYDSMECAYAQAQLKVIELNRKYNRNV